MLMHFEKKKYVHKKNELDLEYGKSTYLIPV